LLGLRIKNQFEERTNIFQNIFSFAQISRFYQGSELSKFRINNCKNFVIFNKFGEIKGFLREKIREFLKNGLYWIIWFICQNEWKLGGVTALPSLAALPSPAVVYN